MRFFLLCLTVPFLLCGSEESYEQSIRDWLTVRDVGCAIQTAKEGCELYPESEEIRSLYITSLARSARIKEMLSQWRQLQHIDKEAAFDRDLLEELAWGVIHYGNKSSSPMVRLISMLAAAYSQDVVGVRLIREQLTSPNSLLRAIACELTTKLGDEAFAEPLTYLVHHERVPQVRALAIVAAGALRIGSLQEVFANLIDNPSSSEEEKEASLEALLHLQGEVTRKEIDTLLGGKREHQRMVGCKIALTAKCPLEPELFLPLLEDRSAMVRLSAIRTLGLLFYQDEEHRETLLEVTEEGRNDPNSLVQVTALWLHTLLMPEASFSYWKSYFLHPDEETRLYASGLIGTAGLRAYPIMTSAFYGAQDPFVKWNLALGMIQQRRGVEVAAQTLVEALGSNHPRWMWKEKMGVRYLFPASLSYSRKEGSPIDSHHLCQLEILNVISFFDPARAAEGFTRFLKQRTWNISGPAAALLLTEGPQEAQEVVKNLINERDFPFKTEAAILLALWGGDAASAHYLLERYPTCERKHKEAILEALGKVGDMECLPFLVERLQEPFPVLRMIAASSILQVLNH